MIVGRKVASRMGISTGWQRIQREMEEPSQLRMFIFHFKDKESWKSALSHFSQRGAAVSDGDIGIEANVKEQVWDYGEAGYKKYDKK
jgi:hypothetical protein